MKSDFSRHGGKKGEGRKSKEFRQEISEKGGEPTGGSECTNFFGLQAKVLLFCSNKYVGSIQSGKWRKNI